MRRREALEQQSAAMPPEPALAPAQPPAGARLQPGTCADCGQHFGRLLRAHRKHGCPDVKKP